MSKEYIVKNRSAGMVTYRIPELNVRRVFQPGETKKLSHDELQSLSFTPGGKELMADYLQIRDAAALEELNINVEPEYYMDREQVIELIKSGSFDQWLDALDFAPAGVMDMIKDLSISIPLTDYNKRQALKEKTGLDIDRAIANKKADEEHEEVVAPTTTRRATPIVDAAAKGETKAPTRRIKTEN